MNFQFIIIFALVLPSIRHLPPQRIHQVDNISTVFNISRSHLVLHSFHIITPIISCKKLPHGFKATSRLSSLILFLHLVLSGDVESNPGPSDIYNHMPYAGPSGLHHLPELPIAQPTSSPEAKSIYYKLLNNHLREAQTTTHLQFLENCLHFATPKGLKINIMPQMSFPSNLWNQIIHNAEKYILHNIILQHRTTLRSIIDEQNELTSIFKSITDSSSFDTYLFYIRQKSLKATGKYRTTHTKKFKNINYAQPAEDLHEQIVASRDNTAAPKTCLTKKKPASHPNHTHHSHSITKQPSLVFWNRNKQNWSNITKGRNQNSKPVNRIVNLSKLKLNDNHMALLERGLKFCPRPKHINTTQLLTDLDEFTRKLRLKQYFQLNPNPNDTVHYTKLFPKISRWCPPIIKDNPIEEFSKNLKKEILHCSNKKTKDNISKAEKQALQELKNNNDIIIKQADKGGATVLMDRVDYMNECNKQLEDKQYYTELENDNTIALNNKFVKSLKYDGQLPGLDEDLDISELVNKFPKPGIFYTLPKVHKEGNPGRPIVANYNTITWKASRYIDHVLQPFVQRLPSYIKDTTHFIKTTEQIHIQPNSTLVTLDVKSLYTNIPHTDGIIACRHYLEAVYSREETTFLTKLIHSILTNNNFSFNNRHFLQTKGTAMGTKMAPSYANLLMGWLEQHLFTQCEHKPTHWLRYIDDIFFLWPHDPILLPSFLDHINKQHNSIKFTMESGTPRLPFLDLNLSIIDNKIDIDLYTKPTSTNPFLYAGSCHPASCKKALPYSLALRLKRICSSEQSLKTRLLELRSQLKERGYKDNDINVAFNKVEMKSREDTLQNTKGNDTKACTSRIPFVITFTILH